MYTVCIVCQKTLKWTDNLEQHVRVLSVHSGGEKVFQCPHGCRKSTRMNTHQCSVCQKLFTEKGQLDKHMTEHSGEKPYQCSVCLKSFTRNYDLKRHGMTVHTAEKRYKCSLCQMSFAQMHRLNSHMKSHTADKPYQRSVSQKSFAFMRELTWHNCSVCQKSFAYKSSLTRHKKVHNRKKPINPFVYENSFIQGSHLKTKSHTCVQVKEERTCNDFVCQKTSSPTSFTEKFPNKNIINVNIQDVNSCFNLQTIKQEPDNGNCEEFGGSCHLNDSNFFDRAGEKPYDSVVSDGENMGHMNLFLPSEMKLDCDDEEPADKVLKRE